MSVKAIPQGLTSVTPQLSIDGAAEAIELYKKAFGAEELRRAGDPSGKKIWHAEIKIGNAVLFVNDTFPDMGGKATHTQLWLYSENVDAAWKRAEGAGLKVAMPLAEMFWGDKMGTLIDKWGNQWTLAQHTRDMSADEMKKAQDGFVASMPKK